MNTSAQKVQISRLNRILASDSKKIITTRGAQTIAALGVHHLIDSHRNVIIDTCVDLDEFESQLQTEAGR